MELVQFQNYVYATEVHKGMFLIQNFCELNVLTVTGLVVEGDSFIFRKDDLRVEKISEMTRTSLEIARYALRKYKKFLRSECERNNKSKQPLKEL